jgi:hypothetical protein
MSLGFNDSSTNSQSSSTGTTSGQSATAKTLSADQAAIQPSIFATLQQYMMNPQAAVNPSRMAARNQVNNDYSGLADQVRQQFLTTGGGSSGKAGQAQLQGSIGQAGALANVDNSAAQQAAALPLTAEQLAAQFLGINMGSSTTSSGTTTGTTKGSSSSSGFNASVSPLSILGGFAGLGGGGGASGATFANDSAVADGTVD